MTVYKLPELSALPSLPEGASAALGNFDGVHIGHRELFRAAAEKRPSVIWTFSVPAKPGAPVKFITSPGERLSLFSESGADYAVTVDFDSVKDMTPEEFVRDHLKGTLHISRAVCGYNFRFGRGGAGNADGLRALCEKYGLECTVVPEVSADGREVSSSLIRELISRGDTESAAKYLGRSFSLCAPVIHGKGLGRSCGFPTVNQLFPEDCIVPACGVYAAAVEVDGKVYPGAANVGMRPTVSDGNDVNCETYIIGFSGDLYGKTVRVSFLRKIRDEITFPDTDRLFARIREDSEICLRIFGEFSERNQL